MNCEQARRIDIVDFLARLGYNPVKGPTGRNEYWYYSPLRDERTPSFKVNRTTNEWRDFGGDGGGGSVVDLCCKMLNGATVSDTLDYLSRMEGAPLIKVPQQRRQPTKKSDIKIISVRQIKSPPLLRYLSTRNISSDVAARFLQEVTFTLNGKTFYSLGWINNAGGYELRNAFFKGSTAPKDALFICGSSKRLAVFEGMFDFLSYATHMQILGRQLPDILILNSTSFLEKSILLMERYDHVDLYLDDDQAGRKCTRRLCEGKADNGIYFDRSEIYRYRKDYNNWWARFNPGKGKLLAKKSNYQISI
ncbi:Toprim-like [Chitinophaga terrae (ex Kim and Jung 2007)]|uniref:Toprim-like n=1 Tax=Chitinophaga terrae (ex Kim and Jung 2007) TaxID=408074 RepID=A0A1H4GEC9_9BACT|nr:toprim domain-containing protein [Chitinophaga terrae (ex Kim and Jung 2007)]SEB07072.1 Toprim-like [Chitinophaga terrae (ex Kim and Jung 2007)]